MLRDPSPSVMNTADVRKPFDMLRQVLEELTRRKLPPSPGHYAAVYRRLEAEAGSDPDAITRSELQLCAALIDALEGLYANGGWLHTQVGQLRAALQDDRSPLTAQINAAETVIRNIALNKARAAAEAQDFSEELKKTIAHIHEEVRAAIVSVGGSDDSMAEYTERLARCGDLSEARILLGEVSAHVRTLSSSLRQTGKALLETRNFLETTTRRLDEANKRAAQNALDAEADPLSGALNRRGLERALRSCPRGDISLIVFDIDDFKRVNDTFGHGVGDLVIQGFSHTLRSGLRESDLLARIGGEEFVVVLPGMRMPRARQVADRMLELIRGWRHSNVARQHGLNITASGGIASCTMGGSVDVGELLRMTLEVADRHLYDAKRAGKNRVLPD